MVDSNYQTEKEFLDDQYIVAQHYVNEYMNSGVKVGKLSNPKIIALKGMR